MVKYFFTKYSYPHYFSTDPKTSVLSLYKKHLFAYKKTQPLASGTATAFVATCKRLR